MIAVVFFRKHAIEKHYYGKFETDKRFQYINERSYISDK